MLVANPLPEKNVLPRDLAEAALAQALADLAREGVRGRAVTPFLLERMRVLTGDRRVAAELGGLCAG